MVSTLRPILSQKKKAAIFLDETSNVVFANKQAHDLCAKSETLSIDNGSLITFSSSQNLELQKNLNMVTAQLKSRTIFWEENNFSHPLRVDIFPVVSDLELVPRKSVPKILTLETIGLVKPKISDKFNELYKLTPTEFETVQSLAQGMSLSTFAEQKGNCISTVRWTMRNIFSKTKTNSQKDLVALAGLFFD